MDLASEETPPPPRFNSCQRQPPLSDHSVFAFWVVAYERFDYSNFSIVENSFHPDYRRCLLHIALLPSADISNRQSFISIDDPRPRFSDSAFKLAYSMMWRPRASGGECLLSMGIRIHSLPPTYPTLLIQEQR